MASTSNGPSTLTPRTGVIEPGERAPDFELPTQERGKKWRLSDALKGGDVVIAFFPFAFTGVCGKEMECITSELSKFEGKHAQAVGLSGDSGPALNAWAQQLGLKQTLLNDTHRDVAKAYGLYWPEMNTSWRGTVVVGQDGRVKWSQKRDIPQAFSIDDVMNALA